ncbi:hypothetical protein D9M72_498160 [compost metagenome]
MAGTVHDHAVLGAGLLADLIDGGDEFVPGPGVLDGGREGDAGLLEEALVDEQADGGEVRGNRRQDPVRGFLEELLFDVARLGNVGEVLQLVHPERVDAGDPRQCRQVVGRRGVLQLGGDVRRRDVNHFNGDAGGFFVLLGGGGKGTALVGVTGKNQLKGL